MEMLPIVNVKVSCLCILLERFLGLYMIWCGNEGAKDIWIEL